MKLIKREFRKAVHRYKTASHPDTHIISELLTYEDGSIEKKFNIIENYKRPFFITKKIYRKRHKQKIEYDDLEHLERLDVTESDALRKLSYKLGMRGRPDMRKLKESPYLYWGDVRASTVIKKIYNSKLKGTFTPFDICGLDIEADILTKEISLITITMGKVSYTYISKTWMGNIDEVSFKAKVFKTYAKEAPDVVSVSEDGIITYTSDRKEKLNLIFCRDEGKVITECIAKVHSLKPDILTAWGAIYDIETIAMRAVNKWNIVLKDLFSDPEIPSHLRHFRIKKDDSDYKKMNSGKESFVPFHARWHIFESTSYFTILDNMSAFFYIRNGSEPQVPGGYSLDNILFNYVKFKKLKPSIEGLEFLDKGRWNKVMSDEHKEEYTAYNVFDSKSLNMLDEKTNDLRINLPLLLQDSEFDIFKSGPKKLLDSYTFFLLDNGKAIGTKSPTMTKIEGLGTKDWIVTLDAWKKGFYNTLKTFNGIETVRGNIRLLTTDLDIISSYPFQTLMFGLGTQRTSRELLDIEGFEKKYFIKQNLGICTGSVHALGYSSNMLNMPTVFEIDKFMQRRNQ